MKYYYQVEGDTRNNIGDVLQGMVAKAFLPTDARVADREDLAHLDKSEPGFLIANGWYMHSFDNFPPPENVKPLYVSMHIAKSKLLADPKIRAHFIKHAPIGCRDIKTLHLFLGWGIPAYFSSCLTTTTKAHGQINISGEGEVLLVDNVDHPVSHEIKTKLELLIGKPLVSISHDPPETQGDLESYTVSAERHMNTLLERYCKAAIVITTKIHCALPCLGMGAKVVMIHPHPKEGRLAPLAEFIDIISYEDILSSTSLNVPEVRQKTLKKRREFLSRLVKESAEVGYNALSKPSNFEFRLLRFKSELMAKVYRIGLVIAYKLGFAKETIERVYGAGL
jgi:hypothetical protein